MKKLNVIAGLIFGLISLVHAVSGNWLAAATSGILAAGFALSDLTYAPNLAHEEAAAITQLPAWRRYSSMLLVGAALLLFGYQIGHDISAKMKRTNTENTSRR